MSRAFGGANVLRAALGGLAIGVGIVLTVAVWRFSIDDAFVVFRFAHNLVAHGHYGMNVDVTGDGVTSPLWLFFLTLLTFAAPEQVTLFSKLLGLGFALSAALLVVRRALKVSEHAGLLALCVFASSVSFWMWSVGGLETSLAALLVALFVIALFEGDSEEEAPGKALGFALVAAFLIPWTRPEITLAVFLGAMCSQGSKKERVLLCAGALLGSLSVAAFRVILFSSPLPIALSAKGAPVSVGIRYVFVGSAFVFSVVACVLVVRFARALFRHYLTTAADALATVADAPARGQAIIVFVVTALLSIAAAGGDWMPGFRLLVPLLPAITLLVVSLSWSNREFLAIALLQLVVSSVGGAVYASMVAESTRYYEQTAQIASKLRGLRSVALVDVGRLGFELLDMDIVDLGGITDSEVAAMPGQHIERHIEASYLLDRNPDAVVLHSSIRPEIIAVQGRHTLHRFAGYPLENGMVAAMYFRARYEPVEIIEYSPDYFYVVFLRTDVE